MKCKVCGAESGKYPLCRLCNAKKEQNLIIKCEKCGNWHYANEQCRIEENHEKSEEYLYSLKSKLITKSEQAYFEAIKASLPEGYNLFPQINLASFIVRTDDARYHNELFRNVDFLVTDEEYKPRIVIEINDQSHLEKERRERDEKVKSICDEAGIPLIKLWTSYGINPDYIKNKINETLSAPVIRISHHVFENQNSIEKPIAAQTQNKTPQGKKGCYIATCVYGSYDCAQVWTLRRYRDEVLAKTWYGRTFIKIYYSISPKVVKVFGRSRWFKRFWRNRLDKKITKLNNNGIKSTPYIDT